MNKNKIKQCFNRAYQSYDNACQTQIHIANSLIKKIVELNNTYENVIDLGCGTGMITEMLAQQIQFKNFYALDIADRLLERAHQRLRAYPIELIETDFENFNYAQYDLIFSNMSLQWSSDFSAMLKTILSSLKTDGILAFSLPLQGTFCELKSAFRNPFYPAKVIKKLLAEQNLQLLFSQSETLSYTFSSPFLALKSIRAVGANYLFSAEKTARSKCNQLINNVFSTKNLKKTPKLSYVLGNFIVKKNDDNA